MSATTTIEWTDKSWNPVRGCDLVSAGCTNCYAMHFAHRFSGEGQPYEGLTRLGPRGPVWTGKVRQVPESLDEPLRWRKPCRVFVNSMSDLFHEDVSDQFIAAVFGIMAMAPHHTFQILTKRPARMVAWFEWLKAEYDGPCDQNAVLQTSLGDYARWNHDRYDDQCEAMLDADWPLPNVWLGVSVENQVTADERIPKLLETPAAIRFISAEPLLGPIDLDARELICATWRKGLTIGTYLDWVIVGGESGHGARPMHPEWARSIRDQCQAGAVPFFWKQWGEWLPMDQQPRSLEYPEIVADNYPGLPKGGYPESRCHRWPDATDSYRVGKRFAGRLLDGVEHNEFPDAALTAK